ncbi:unnamed protein product [Pylaiella littoralis]
MNHQQRVIDHMKKVADGFEKGGGHHESKGLLVAHGMGSGKTLTALWVAKSFLSRARVSLVHIVAPNVAVAEFATSMKLAGITPTQAKQIKIVTHDGFASLKSGSRVKNSLVIVDEAHLFTKTKYLDLVKRDVRYLLLLSGTPCPNEPRDIVPIVNMLLRNKRNRWSTKTWLNADERRQRAFLRDKVSVYNIGPTHNYIGYIGHSKRTIGPGYPDFRVNIVKVPLQTSQEKRYAALAKTREKKSAVSKNMYPFFSRERKIVNEYHKDIDCTMGVKATPKIMKVAADIVRSVKRSNNGTNKRLEGGRILVYVHHYQTLTILKRAITTLCDAKQKEIVISEYNGDTSEHQRHKVKDAFNGGETDVLIVSQAGSVGLDLKCTSKVFMLDVYWNVPTMNQIIGRAIRTNSHDEKKTGCRHNHVDVKIYISGFSKKYRRKKVYDDHILTQAEKKWSDVATMITSVMEKASI